MKRKRMGLCCAVMQLFICSNIVSAAGPEVLLEAAMPVEVLELDAALATGELHGPRMRLNGPPSIGRQPARVFRGIVPEPHESKPPFERVLALTLLGGIQRDASVAEPTWSRVPKSREAWCSLKKDPQSTVRCYQDSDADGRLEIERDGNILGMDGTAVITVGAARRIEPIGYRVARTDELPTMQLGYYSCNLPNQFGMELQWIIDGKPKQGPHGACRILGSSIEGSPSMLQIDRFKVTVTESDGKLATRVVAGMAAGTVLGGLRIDRPLTNLTDTKSMLDRLKAQVGSKPYLHFTAPPTAAAADVAEGGEIIGGSVDHGIKGRLAAPILVKQGYGRSYEIPAGQSIYGIPMSATEGARRSEIEVVWCLPRFDEKKKQWLTDCFSNGGSVTQIATVRGTPFAIERLFTMPRSPSTSLPSVERDVGDFGPLRISVRLKRWGSKDVALAVSVEPQQGAVSAWEYRFKPAADGSVSLSFGRGVLKLAPSQTVRKGVSVEVITPVAEGDAALPRGNGGPNTE